jgi:hypothetical protein
MSMLQGFLVLLILAIPFAALFHIFAKNMAAFAKSKGYEYWNWYWATSILGLILLFSQPDLRKLSGTARKEAKYIGNNMGIVVAVFQWGGLVFLLIKDSIERAGR